MADIHMPCGCHAYLEASEDVVDGKIVKNFPNGEIFYCDAHSADRKRLEKARSEIMSEIWDHQGMSYEMANMIEKVVIDIFSKVLDGKSDD